ncbi:MAG: hypothetical protein KAV42_10980 [Candidatus Krumholzibacteria bacterium]|nr:hypothetical protein [Candidatus Krumholzibacteria bacterium]
MAETIYFKGWEVPLEDLETMIALCKLTGMKSMVFSAACIKSEEVVEFIDPKGGEYRYEKFKLFIKGSTIKATPEGVLCSLSLVPVVTYFDEFPPIPPVPYDGP